MLKVVSLLAITYLTISNINSALADDDFFFAENSDCRIVIRAACISNGFSADAIESQPVYVKHFFEKDSPGQAAISIEDSSVSGYNCSQIPRGPDAPPAVIQLLIRGVNGVNRRCMQFWTKATKNSPLEREKLTSIASNFHFYDYHLTLLDNDETLCESDPYSTGLYNIFNKKNMGGKYFYKCVKDDPRYASKPQAMPPPPGKPSIEPADPNK